MYSYVSDELAGFFERLSTVMAAVREATAIYVFLVVSGTRRERPGKEASTRNSNWFTTTKEAQQYHRDHLRFF